MQKEKISIENNLPFEKWEVKSFVDTYRIWQKLTSNKHLFITGEAILKIIAVNKDTPQKTKAKAIERAVKKLKELFCLEDTDLSYSRSVRAYKLSPTAINCDNQTTYKLLYDLLISVNISKKLDFDEVVKISNAFQFEYQSFKSNIPTIFQLIEAIEKKKAVRFKHFNYYSGLIAEHLVEPWFIKPFKGKFFLGCYRLEKDDKPDGNYRHFTISQILAETLEITEQTIDKNRKEAKYPELEANLFERCIGVRMSNEETSLPSYRADIHIETNYLVGQEWKNSPKHPAQECIKEANGTNDTFEFLFRDFYFNDAFRQIILENGAKVKILNPPEIIEEVKRELIKTLESMFK